MSLSSLVRVPDDESEGTNVATLILFVELELAIETNNFVTLPQVHLTELPKALLLTDALNARALVIEVYIRH